MILPGLCMGAWIRASSSGSASPPGRRSASRPCSMYSSRLAPPKGWISPSSMWPTLGPPSPVEYVTNFKAAPSFNSSSLQRHLSSNGGFPARYGDLRLETFPLPTPVFRSAVLQPVVQAVLAPLPELDDLRFDAVA